VLAQQFACQQCRDRKHPAVTQQRQEEVERKAEERRKEDEERQVEVVRKAEERRKEEEKRVLQDQRKAAQTREEERVRVEAKTNEALVREAPRRARDSFDALRSLGEAYQFVCSHIYVYTYIYKYIYIYNGSTNKGSENQSRHLSVF